MIFRAGQADYTYNYIENEVERAYIYICIQYTLTMSLLSVCFLHRETQLCLLLSLSGGEMKLLFVLKLVLRHYPSIVPTSYSSHMHVKFTILKMR